MALLVAIFIAAAIGFVFAISLQWYSTAIRQAPESRPPNPSTGDNETRTETCYRVIRGEIGPSECPNALTGLEARAIPNRRLVEGFGIDNAFTTTEKAHAAGFVRQAGKSMQLSGSKWRELSNIAREEVSPFLTASAEDADVHLTRMVQVISLGLAFRVFVDRTESSPTSGGLDNILIIADAVNDIWMKSKIPGAQVSYAEQRHLHDALRAVCPDHDPLNPRENPLNWILPSYETMWRVVLRALLEVKFITGRAHPEWNLAMIAFAKNPTKEQFKTLFPLQLNDGTEPDSVSVKAIVDEALRLYPPTRHVKRVFRSSNEAEPQVLEADIEGAHVDEAIWGSNALEFVPGRWNGLSSIQQRSFVPFGCRPFECPAKPVFGPRMIGLIVGTLLDVLQEGEYHRLGCADEEVERELRAGGRLGLGRERYSDVVLKKL